MVLMRDLWNFSFFGRGDVSPTHSELCRFVSGSQANHQVSSPVIILFKKNSVCIGPRDKVLERCDYLPFAQASRSVEQNVHTAFSFPNPLSECEELQSWRCSKILLSFLMRFDRHFGQISNSSNVYLSSSRFWMTTSLVIFYQLPSVSKSRIPPKNVRLVQSLIPISLWHQYWCFCCRQIGFETKFYGNSLFNSAIHDV